MGNLALRGCREKEDLEVQKAHREHQESLVKRSVCLNISLLFHELQEREREKCEDIFIKEYLTINLKENAFKKCSLYRNKNVSARNNRSVFLLECSCCYFMFVNVKHNKQHFFFSYFLLL